MGFLDLPDRVLNKIEPDQHTGCWEWTAGRNRKGYGQVWFRGKQMLAHRVTYESSEGEIPDGLVIDHMCENPGCVRPDHLEPVTNAENIRRGSAHNGNKTHCPQGHPYSGRAGRASE